MYNINFVTVNKYVIRVIFYEKLSRNFAPFQGGWNNAYL